MKTKLTKKQIQEVMNNLEEIAVHIGMENRTEYAIEANANLEMLLPIAGIDPHIYRIAMEKDDKDAILRNLCCLIFRVNNCIQGTEIPLHRLREDLYWSEKAKQEATA